MSKLSAEHQNTPISKAVEPLRKAAVQRAGDNAQGVIDKLHKELKENDYDAKKVAPYPHSISVWDREKHSRAKAKHDLVNRLFHHDHERNRAAGNIGSSRDASRYVKPHPESHERFVNSAKEDAHAQYDAFVHKLHDKVGEHTSAELHGNHVWGHSLLHVKKADGSTEKWKTQMIFKLSKLGKPHNQWPTRKVK